MPKTKHEASSLAIGRRLKGWREERGLSLRNVEDASRTFPEHVGFDYLSRLERGELMPSVPKLATLAGVYGRPLSELVDLYEIEELRKLIPKRGGYELLRKLGKESLANGELTRALACFLGALDRARRERMEPQQIAVAYNNVGAALIRSERYLAAKSYLEEALRLVRSASTKARILDNLAIVHYHLDHLALAEILSRESYDLGATDAALRPITRATRAAVLADLKRHAEAEQLFREAMDEFRKAGNLTEEARARYNLGSCLVEGGEVEEGLRHLRAACAQAAERGSPELRTRSQFFFGRALYKTGRKEEAVGPLASALRMAERNNMRNEAFHSAYYLWRLALEGTQVSEETDYYEVARQHRVWLQQNSDEATAFDALKDSLRPGKRAPQARPRAARA